MKPLKGEYISGILMCKLREVNGLNYQKASLFEHSFWLQVLGDHARFIFHNLSPIEVENIQQTQHFLQATDHLLYQVRKMETASPEKWMELSQHAYALVESFRQYKLYLINAHLECKVKIGLPPSFINHMVNEIEEYMRVLSYLVRGEIPSKLHPVHHHNIWLLDAKGHADALQGELDPTESMLLKKTEEFSKTFESFYIKAREMAGFLRARQDLFPALREFDKETSAEIVLFHGFLNELQELRLDCRRLGTLMPLLTDHMAREACYYLLKINEVDPESVILTACDPTKPRVET
jgi:hypothetical protein